MEVGIRELKQNASAVLREVAQHGRVVVTDRGRAVAQVTPVTNGIVETLIMSGEMRPALGSLADLPAPLPGPAISAELHRMRDSERY